MSITKNKQSVENLKNKHLQAAKKNIVEAETAKFLSEVEKAKQLLQEENAKRVKACGEEINATLEKHGMNLIAFGQFQGNQITTNISVVPKQ